ncbi:hypothetical protein KJ909_02150 [Patescibacteria group bacterium]|nr:hypothetical protein [Patescibacteria group bacterium]
MKKKIIIIILLAFLVVLLRLPSLFEPHRYADEDIYLTLGQALRKGLVFYRDIHDNKPPLLYVVAAIAGNVPFFRLILLFWNLVNVYFIWLISQKFFKKLSLQFISTFLFAIFSCIPLLEGNIANGEIFMIMPTTAAVLLLTKKTNYFAAGLLFSLAFLFKVPVIFELFTLIFFITVYQQKKLFSSSVLLLLLGFLLPILASILYYSLHSAGQPYVRAALMQNIGYLGSWEGQSAPFYQSGLFIRGLIFAFLVLLIFLSRRFLNNKFALISLWFLGALFGSLLSGRPYPHYFIELLPPASLLLVYVFTQKSKLIAFYSFLFFSLTAFSLYYYQFWHYQTIPYYKNFILYATGQIDRQNYYSFWGQSVLTNYDIGQYLKKNTTPDQKIFVWGTEPAIYAISDRLPLGKYTVAYHIIDFQAKDQTIKNILATPPRFIVYFPDNPEFQKLDDLLLKHYTVVKIFPPALIYRQNDSI